MLFTTTITAINPHTKELCSWRGINIEAISFKMAQKYCDENGLGYLLVDGILRELDDNYKIVPLQARKLRCVMDSHLPCLT